ncbi:polysaccharide deacetylase family protein [Niveibacterium sp. 24ML]|uniref:polysaccharide deacetylase family protein n=1 Tax=Niveibacterium sp. 24ML TaxID=2985512 RepID=UPI00226E413F|nr:polysaccharide deacetylase family protein [Niveibacterium sp. 24ML]MCX9156871.1 polysaccharide deacetylase family protein [Niveibacterium sp. 24ML]
MFSPRGAKGRLSIFIWHRVLPAHDPMFPGELHAARFEATLAWIGRWFNVLALDEAVRLMARGELPARAAAITFDDGYADNLTVAAPLLQKAGLPATFFIASGYLDGGRMWNDGLIEAVRRSPLDVLDTSQWGRFPLPDWAARGAAAQGLIDKIKYLEPAERELAVTEVARAARSTQPTDLMMSSAQVRELAQRGFAIGAHTVTHPILARIGSEKARTEIAEGRAALERMIGARVPLFAYPNGKPGRDYLPEHVDMVRALGFDAAVSTAWGASAQGDDVFQLRRFTPWDEGRFRFGVRLAKNLAQPGPEALV